MVCNMYSSPLLMRGPSRRHTGPILLGHAPGASKESAFAPNDSQVPWQELPSHRDEYQVQLDVERSFIYYPDSEFIRQDRSAPGVLSSNKLQKISATQSCLYARPSCQTSSLKSSGGTHS